MAIEYTASLLSVSLPVLWSFICLVVVVRQLDPDLFEIYLSERGVILTAGVTAVMAGAKLVIG